MHRIAPPPPPLPEFMNEAHYLSDFIVRWKLKLQGVEDKDIGVVDVALLMEWSRHRKSLQAGYSSLNPRHKIIFPLINFVNELVLDWFCELTGAPPAYNILDTHRMLSLEKLWQKLNNIPGEKWEIKY